MATEGSVVSELVPSLSATSVPAKPKKIATHLRIPTVSLRNSTARIVVKIGVANPSAAICANGVTLSAPKIEKTQHSNHLERSAQHVEPDVIRSDGEK